MEGQSYKSLRDGRVWEDKYSGWLLDRWMGWEGEKEWKDKMTIEQTVRAFLTTVKLLVQLIVSVSILYKAFYAIPVLKAISKKLLISNIKMSCN